MAKYRLLEPVSYIHEGKTVSVKAGRVVELTDEQAASLAGKLDPIASADSMFPNGRPHIDPWFAQREVVVTGDKPEAPQPAPVEPAPVKKGR